jgi:hypothetical protein
MAGPGVPPRLSYPGGTLGTAAGALAGRGAAPIGADLADLLANYGSD